LNAPTKEKIYTIAGLEFSQGKEGRLVMIVWAQYGLRSSGAWWHDHLVAALWQAGFKACKVDADVWMRPAVKADGSKYYEYVLCYIDDILIVSERPKRIMEGLEAKYILKAGSVGEPKMYLRAKVSKYWLEHSDNPDKVQWSLLAEDYINHMVKDVETELEKVSKELLTKVMTPTMADYHLELDQSKELGPVQAMSFAGLIGILHWCIKL
jgi:hypothetical protein